MRVSGGCEGGLKVDKLKLDTLTGSYLGKEVRSLGNKRPKDMSLLAQGRKASLMSQEDIAKKIGTTIQTISAWENKPEAMQIRDLASYYGALKTAGKPFVEKFIEEAII